MNRLKFSASTLASASTVLPRAEVIPLPTAKRKPVEPCAFTKATVRKLQCPAGRAEAFFWDAACRGFGVRALKSGRRSWVFQYRDRHGRTRRIALGDLTAVALEDAREVARRTAAGVVQGSNPSVDRRIIVPPGLSSSLSKPTYAIQKGAKNHAHLRKLPDTFAFMRRPFTTSAR